MRLLAVILALAAGQMTARGDGGYVPATSYPAPPKIPSQTALIVHEAGVETLLVESTMRAEQGDRFAWILPLPEKPESIEKAEPGTLDTLRFCVGPEIDGGPGHPGLGFNVFVFFPGGSCL